MSRFTDALSLFSPSFEGKAVAGQTPTIPGSREFAPEIYGMNLTTTAGSKYCGASAKRQLEVYGSGTQHAIDWVADAIDVIADIAATAEWHLEDYEGKTVPRSRAEADPSARLADPWLVQLLEEPNGWQSYKEVIKLAWIDKFITGDAFIYKRGESPDGHSLQLQRLEPYYVEVLPGKGGRLIDAYEYKVPGQTPIKIDPSRIIHWKGPNPHSRYRGLGIIAKGPRVFDLEVALTETKTSYFENGARLGGVLESDAAISDSLSTKLRRQFSGIYAGVKQAFQVAVLGRGLQYKPIQSDAMHAEFAAMSDQSRDRIFVACSRVPRAMLGLAVETSSTTAPAEERRVFANTVMRPALDEFQDLLTRHLTADFGLKFCVDYEYQMPIEDQFKLGGEFAKVPGVTVKEVRKQFNLAPLRDVIKDQIKAEEIEDLVLNMPGENGPESNVKDQPLPGEPGKVPDPAATATFDEKAQRSSAAVK